MKWLIWSNEHGQWWAPASQGYTPSRKRAGRYSLEEATEIVAGANICQRDNAVPNEAMVRDESEVV